MGVRGLVRKAHAPKHKQSSSSTLLRFLSPKRQELIRPVLEHPRGYVLLSVRGLARKLGADPATTIRIVQGMGFASFQEFQRYLHELSILHATSLERMQTSSARDSNIPAHMQETLERNLKNLQTLRHSLDFQRVAALARRTRVVGWLICRIRCQTSASPSPAGLPPEAEQRTQPPEAEQKTQPPEAEQKTQPPEAEQRTQPPEAEQKTEP